MQQKNSDIAQIELKENQKKWEKNSKAYIN